MTPTPEQEEPLGRAAGVKDTAWKAVTIPETLYARIRALAHTEGISISLKTRKLLEAALGETSEAT